MIAKGTIPRGQPPFSGQLTRVTGEGEQVTVAFTAADAETLAAAVQIAGDAAENRVRANNAKILAAGDTFAERQAHVYQQALAQLRHELGLPDPAPAEGKATLADADDSAGALHAAENP